MIRGVDTQLPLFSAAYLCVCVCVCACLCVCATIKKKMHTQLPLVCGIKREYEKGECVCACEGGRVRTDFFFPYLDTSVSMYAGGHFLSPFLFYTHPPFFFLVTSLCSDSRLGIDTETHRETHRDTWTQRHRHTDTQRQRDTDTQRHRDI